MALKTFGERLEKEASDAHPRMILMIVYLMVKVKDCLAPSSGLCAYVLWSMIGNLFKITQHRKTIQVIILSTVPKAVHN